MRNYNHLYYFYVVAKLGGVTLAARQLNTSQSSLSTQLKTLEAHLDLTLFTREGRGLTLTTDRMLENDGRVVSNFVVQALRGSELTVYGDGSQTRSFCYVSDLVEGMVRLMNTETDDIHLPVNIGNPGEFTMNELADEVGKVTGKPIKIKYLPLAQDDPKQRRPNIARAGKLLNWKPTVPLTEGLKKTADYFQDVIR